MEQQHPKSALIADYDHSLSSIGSRQQIEDIFGMPPITPQDGINGLKGYLNKLFRQTVVKTTHPIFETESTETQVSLSDKAAQLNLGYLIIDTVSALGLQERELLKKSDGNATMSMQNWGVYGDRMNNLFYTLSLLPVTVICTCHIEMDKDDMGAIRNVPAIKGGAKLDMLKWFDVVVYCRNFHDKETGGWSYMWQTVQDEAHYAKNRGGLLDPMMPQDLGEIVRRYESKGIKAKILILGHSGSGKTYSLKTLFTDERLPEADLQVSANHPGRPAASPSARRGPTAQPHQAGGADDPDGQGDNFGQSLNGAAQPPAAHAHDHLDF